MGYVYMPRVDPGMETGTVVEWLKRVGDQVRRGDALVVVEGEKTTFEISAPADGVLTQILCPAGTDVRVAEPVAVIGETPQAVASPAWPETVPPTAATTQTVTAPLPLRPKTEREQGERISASPAARRLARERGVNLSQVRGTGPGGRTTTDDVLAAAGAQPRAVTVPSSAGEIVETFTLAGIRRTIAERLSHSWKTSVPVSLNIDVSFDAIWARRPEDERQCDRRLSVTVYVAKAAAGALQEHRRLNAAIEGDQVRVFREVNLGVAVDTPHGLMAPVIRRAEQKPLAALGAELDELTEKAMNRRLSLEELTGSTFTVTNLGGFGVTSFAPIINPPNVAVVGIGAVELRPIIVDGQVQPKRIGTLTLVFDHRVVDGAPAAAFLQSLKQRLEAGRVE